MDRQQLNLNFKGDRTYIQGGDIYNAVDRYVRAADAAAYISNLMFRSFAKQDCDLLWDRPSSAETLIAQGTVCHPDSKQPFWIIESTRPAAGRYSYDENSIIEPAVSDGEQIILETRSAYSLIEEIIALTKRLSYELTPDIEGKWVYGQSTHSCSLPDEYSHLKITRKSVVPGRFSVNDIEIDAKRVGDIRFIVGTP